MSDQGKKEKSIARWLKNAEDHSRMEAQLATIKTQVDGLNQWVGKLEDGLTELRKELVGRIDDVQSEAKDGLNKTNTRIDDLRAEMTKGFEKTNARTDDLRAEMTEGFEKTNEKIVKRNEK